MDLFEKAKILGSAGEYDSCGPKMCEVKVQSGLGGIYHAKAEHKTCRIFKTLMDNTCSFDCKYCANASGCKKKAIRYEPDELAKVFDFLNKNLSVDGLFLSSGVSKDPDTATKRMIEAVKIIRQKKGFNGYIHFKVLPGTSYELIKQASKFSTRMSINIEAPNKNILSELSSCKDYKIDILKRQAWISRLELSSGQTTQMMINNLATDKEILRMARWEYDKLSLKRVYYSSFRPVKGTPLEHEKQEPFSRQNHLYNVDFLMRDYKFKLEEFELIMNDGMLPNKDPKLSLAMNFFDKPIDINQASFNDLIRVPGIGPISAKRILESNRKIKRYSELQNFGVWINRAKPFIEVDGKKQKMLTAFS
ncbi:MAG: radical SAM protein [Nanoarchaeota archaeon]|nr:helix-hairpin-helix domain-containing protein [Nanoarchaeota archaeon]MBU1849229.1 helix-hairpin-helix domain-containing protein [Nanoarchaeota archaeon]